MYLKFNFLTLFLLFVDCADTMSKKSKTPVYCLVRWLEDESVGVIPKSSVRKGQTDKVCVGEICEFKFGGKFYDAETLKISGRHACMHVYAYIQVDRSIYPNMYVHTCWNLRTPVVSVPKVM